MKISSATPVIIALTALKGERIAAERHTTFCKAGELSYEEPGGNLVAFARIGR